MSKMDLHHLVSAARTETPVAGLTHDFYAYPARFSPVFASTAIELFSRPGDLVLDPFMGEEQPLSRRSLVDEEQLEPTSTR